MEVEVDPLAQLFRRGLVLQVVTLVAGRTSLLMDDVDFMVTLSGRVALLPPQDATGEPRPGDVQQQSDAWGLWSVVKGHLPNAPRRLGDAGGAPRWMNWRSAYARLLGMQGRPAQLPWQHGALRVFLTRTGTGLRSRRAWRRRALRGGARAAKQQARAQHHGRNNVGRHGGAAEK